MKTLPPVGSVSCIQFAGKKTPVFIVAHFEGQAVYVRKTIADGYYSGILPASGFEEFKAEPVKSADECQPGNHNYMHLPNSESKLVCTRCGKSIVV